MTTTIPKKQMLQMCDVSGLVFGVCPACGEVMKFLGHCQYKCMKCGMHLSCSD